MERKTKAQDLSKSQKTLNKTYKLGSLFDKSDKKTELKKTYTRENDSESSGGITPKKDYVTTKQVNNTAVINQAVKDEKPTESIPAFRVDYTSRKISEAEVYNSTDTDLNMTTEKVGIKTTKLSSIIDDVASIVSAANKTTADSTHTTTSQAIEPSSVINKVTSDPANVTTTTKNATVAFDVMTLAKITVKTNLFRINNDVTYESDHSTNKTAVVYKKTYSTTNANTTTQTTEISSINNNVTSYPFTGLYDTTNMTAIKSTTPNMTSVQQRHNVTKDPDLTELTSSTTAASAVTFSDAVKTSQTTEVSNNNLTSYTDSVSTDVTSKSTNISSTVTPLKYFFIGGGTVTLLFALLMIYFACRRSRKRRKFELRKKQRENKNVIGLEMGVYEEFKKSFYEKRPFDIEDVDFAENVTEVTVVWNQFKKKSTNYFDELLTYK